MYLGITLFCAPFFAMKLFPVLLAVLGLANLPLAIAQDETNETATVPSSPVAPSPQYSYPPGDIRHCPSHAPLNTNQPFYRMDVLPGGGFDNLRNLDMGQVHYHNYSLCRVSNDGKYLLPDNVFVIPILYSNLERFAEYFDHWDDYKSTTASSINVESKGLFSAISGKFSAEYRSVKSHQHKETSKTTRVQIRHKLYTVRLQPDSQLHPTFKARLFEIAANLQNDNDQLANYLAELLVRDYGTHFLSSVDAGGILAQVDYIHYSSDDDNSSPTTIKASAGISFFNKISLHANFSYEVGPSEEERFVSNRTYSQFLTYGGPRVKPPVSVDDWDSGLPNALVAIDRSGDPLHYAITPQTLPELSDITVMRVSNTVYKAIKRYYEINTRQGCTIPGSKNFDFQANVNDNSCSSGQTNFTFGGIYQTCEIDHSFNGTDDLCTSFPNPVLQVNPLTGTTSCPSGYRAVTLSSGKVTHVKQKYVCHNMCHSCGFLWLSECCDCQYVEVSLVSAANYEAFWCASLGDVPPSSGYLFGGYYTSDQSNPFTGTMSCPQHFLPIHFGEDIQVCVSSDYELGSAAAVPFAGFQSCRNGNPLAAPTAVRNDSSRWPKACPQTYTKHLVTVDKGCEINFCIFAGSFDQLSLLPALLPPFMVHPEYKDNISDSIALVGAYGQVWYKGENGEWTLKQDTPKNALLGQASDNNKSDTLPDGAIAAISIGSTLLLGALVAAVVLTGKYFYRRSKKKRYRESSYTQFEDITKTVQPN